MCESMLEEGYGMVAGWTVWFLRADACRLY